MKSKKIILSLLILTLMLVMLWFFLPSYLRKAIIYQHPGIDDYQLFNNRTITASSSPAEWKLSKGYNQLSIDAHLRDSMEQYQTVAYLVIKNDSILHEEYWDNYNDTSLSNSFSMAKSIVGLLVGCAIDDGKIDSVNQKAADYLPFLNNGWGEQLTIGDLLTMSAASSWDESYSSATSITTQAYYGSDLNKLMETITIDEKPGVKFEYESGNTQLLAMILEKATGQSIAHYASEKIWQPIGAKNNALWSLDHADGMEKAYCCFNSNARDFARLGLLILHRGIINGQQIISSGYIDQTITPATYLVDEKGEPLNYYGYHWWIFNYHGMTMPIARGIGGQYIIVIPHYNAVVVRLGHKRSDSQLKNFPVDLYNYVEAALEILK